MKRPAGSLDAGGDVNEYGIPNYIFGASGGGDRKKGRNGAGGAGGAKGPPFVTFLFLVREKQHVDTSLSFNFLDQIIIRVTFVRKRDIGFKNVPRRQKEMLHDLPEQARTEDQFNVCHPPSPPPPLPRSERPD